MSNILGEINRKIKSTRIGTKLAVSYGILILPIIVILTISLVMLYRENLRYNAIIDAAGNASQFSLDFKKDFDYETYLVIVESKTFDESELYAMLDRAEAVVNGLDINSEISLENAKRLGDIAKYLDNLRGYTAQIEENLATGNRYEENIQIWENDVQIVTALIRETIIQFIYNEMQAMKSMHDEINSMYDTMVTTMIAAACIITGIAFAVAYNISRGITKSISKLGSVTEQVARGDLSVRSNLETGDEIGKLGRSLDLMIDRINELLRQVKEEQIMLRKTELELLQSQINPHFLYNTLDTIVWLAEAGDRHQVVEMVGSLSDFFRTTLNQGRDVVSIKDEIRHVRSYLEIQSVRYKDILEYSIEVPEELYEYSIPKITLQPLVENALYHGIKNKRGMGHIRISGEKVANYMLLYVEDNGIGITDERLKQISDKINYGKSEDDEVFGLSNINERIRLKFGNRYGIHVDSTYGEGSKVSLMLPLETLER